MGHIIPDSKSFRPKTDKFELKLLISSFLFQLISICIDDLFQGILDCSSSMFKFLKISARSAATFAEKHLGRATFTQIYATLIIYDKVELEEKFICIVLYLLI